MEGDFWIGDLVSNYSLFSCMEVPCPTMEYIQWIRIEFCCSINIARTRDDHPTTPMRSEEIALEPAVVM
jgi:hypothetical protein